MKLSGQFSKQFQRVHSRFNLFFLANAQAKALHQARCLATQFPGQTAIIGEQDALRTAFTRGLHPGAADYATPETLSNQVSAVQKMFAAKGFSQSLLPQIWLCLALRVTHTNLPIEPSTLKSLQRFIDANGIDTCLPALLNHQPQPLLLPNININNHDEILRDSKVRLIQRASLTISEKDGWQCLLAI